MKTKALIVLFALCAMFSCSSSDDIDILSDPTSIEGFLSRKVRGDGSIAIVNSKEALQQALPDGYKMYMDKVDFSKNDLLLIHGISTSGVADVSKKQAKSDNKIFFEITVLQNWLCVMEPWCVAYVIPKGLSNKNVDVQIKYEQ